MVAKLHDQERLGHEWRGPREKSVGFWKMLIEACSNPGDVVMDCTAMTGLPLASFHCVLLVYVLSDSGLNVCF